ncbi:DUF294 nucleotidyltransferase-like domain-containing protein [Paenibacillus xylaniclasticus]|uniref:DUF294 nucleotidyltransferase-like domain-containing protein n=1 Tax=Paenibacillus xylaniclasticus TaxID=588083 RepID=UPI000FD77B3A|nr:MULTISPECIES: DUF294 nucleotidyltransferase-like domain-containing protein [Paenibacillus]GFN30244.1 hypothetical protein PCURB6_05040 [Paenibacillus curdlanolyticus]
MSDPQRSQLLQLIGEADDAGTLRSLRDHVNARMEAMLSTLPVEQFYTELNEYYDALTRRVIILAEADMARAGMGSPPVPYAYIMFGSGGREEQTLSSDQDSGLVYEDGSCPEEREAYRHYFAELSKRIVILLERLGFPRCEGNVLSDNPGWGKSLSEWVEQLNGWFDEPAWESVRHLLIVADGRCVYGADDLMKRLHDTFNHDMLKHPVMVQRMLDNTMRHKVLIGVFGQLLKEQYGEDAGSLDMKYGAYIPMVNAIRLLAIRHNIRSTSTLTRMAGLRDAGVLTDSEAETYGRTFRLFLKLRLMATEKLEMGMYANNGKLLVSKLTREMIAELKDGLRVGQKLQRRVFKQASSRFR